MHYYVIRFLSRAPYKKPTNILIHFKANHAQKSFIRTWLSPSFSYFFLRFGFARASGTGSGIICLSRIKGAKTAVCLDSVDSTGTSCSSGLSSFDCWLFSGRICSSAEFWFDSSSVVSYSSVDSVPFCCSGLWFVVWKHPDYSERKLN